MGNAKAALASVAMKTLEVSADALNSVLHLGDILTMFGLNPNAQGAGARTGAALSAAAGFVMTPEGAEGAFIGIQEGRAALNTLMQGDFKVMAGAGTSIPFRAAARLGGNAADWQYVTSKSVLEINGYKWQAHWALNVRTGETALEKIKAVGFVR